jgi:hypothetical protein
VWESPALTEVKVPPGGVASPKSFSPQQATVPSVFTAHVWKYPALTEANEPADGLVSAQLLMPQQAMALPVANPQV